MIRISRRELRSLAKVFVLANTPYSLFREYSKHPVVERLRGEACSEVLSRYLDDVSTRAKGNDLSLGLMYAVFVAILTHDERCTGDIARCAGHFDWGPIIADYASKSYPVNQLIVLDQPHITFAQAPPPLTTGITFNS